MIPDFRPMLAYKEPSFRRLTKRFYASPKLDGIRCCNIDGLPRSRSLKQFPNRYTEERFSHELLHGLDGEFIVGEPTDSDVCRKTMSAVSTIEGQPDVHLYVFDDFSRPELPYSERLATLTERVGALRHPNIHVVPQWVIESPEQLLAIETYCLEAGYEGLIVRRMDAPYKFGRATERGMELAKIKRFTDKDARIVGYFEEMHNGNEATTGELGQTVRSSHKENLVGKGRLGGLICKYDGDTITFRVGTGFTNEQRELYWVQRELLLGTLAKIKVFEYGEKDRPRLPVFLALRMKEDV